MGNTGMTQAGTATMGAHAPMDAAHARATTPACCVNGYVYVIKCCVAVLLSTQYCITCSIAGGITQLINFAFLNALILVVAETSR